MRAAVVLLLFCLAGCAEVPRPRPIQPESDTCAECRMTVLPEGHAAEAVDAEGRVWVFDDPGCLALHVHDHPDAFRGAAFFVQDVETKAWVEWNAATFVRADEVASPMNYGWHAFGTAGRAQAFAAAHAGTNASGDALEVLAKDLEGRRWRP